MSECAVVMNRWSTYTGNTALSYQQSKAIKQAVAKVMDCIQRAIELDNAGFMGLRQGAKYANPTTSRSNSPCLHEWSRLLAAKAVTELSLPASLFITVAGCYLFSF